MTLIPVTSEGEPQSGHDVLYRRGDPPISRTAEPDDRRGAMLATERAEVQAGGPPAARCGSACRHVDPLDRLASSHQNRVYHFWREQTVLHHPRRRLEPGSEVGRGPDRADEIGDHPTIRAQWGVPQANLAQPFERRFESEDHQLQWNGATEGVDGLGRVGDHHKLLCRNGHQFLSSVRRPAALDQPSLRADLIGTIDGDVEAVQREGLHRDSELPSCLFSARRGGHAAQRQLPLRQCRQEVGDGGSGAETDPHSAVDHRRCCFPSKLLLPRNVDRHRCPGWATSPSLANLNRDRSSLGDLHSHIGEPTTGGGQRAGPWARDSIGHLSLPYARHLPDQG
jgi:hypothetical protein